MSVPKLFVALSSLMLVVFIPTLSIAEVEPMPNAVNMLQSIQDRNWPIVVALGLMLVVWALRNVVRDRIPKEYLPFLTLSIGVCTAVSLRVSQQVEMNHTWWHGVIQGLVEGITTGLCAMGVWSVGAKKLPIKKRK